jgi:hypothetical protein
VALFFGMLPEPQVAVKPVNPAAESEALLLFFWFKPHPMREPLTAFPGCVVRGRDGFVGVGGLRSRRFIPLFRIATAMRSLFKFRDREGKRSEPESDLIAERRAAE